MISIKRSFGWQVCQQIIRGVVGMLVASIIAHKAGDRGLGILDSSFALVTFLGACAGLGMQRIVTRELCGENPAQGLIKGTSFGLSLVACIVGMMVANFSVWNAPNDERTIVFCASLVLLIQPFSYPISAYFEASGRLDLTAKALCVSLFVSGGARIFFALSDWPLYWQALAFAVDVMVSCCIGALLIRKYFKFWFADWIFDWKIAKKILKESLPLLLASVTAFFYGTLDTLMLKWLVGYEQTGIYGAATRISQIPLFIPGILVGSFTARLMASRTEGGEFSPRDLAALGRALTVVAGIVLAGGWLMGPLAVRILYGENFTASEAVLRVHVVGIFFLILGSMRNHLLVLEKKGKLILLCDLCGALTNLALNFWLIPSHGAMGASWATAVSYCVSFFLINFIHPDLQKYNYRLFQMFRSLNPAAKI